MSGASGLQAGNLFVKKLVLGRGRGLSFSVGCATFAGGQGVAAPPCSLLSGPRRKGSDSGGNRNCFSVAFFGNSCSVEAA